MNYLKDSTKMLVRIPVIEAELQIKTEDYKNLNQYTYYLLNLLYDGKQIEYIEDIIQFNKWQIENELETLEKYGLIEKENEIFTISNLGKNVITRIREINEFNIRKEKVLIDKLTGAILKSDGVYTKVEDRKYTVVKDIFKNVNPTNSKEFFLEHYGKEFTFITEEDVEIELKLQEEYWIEFETAYYKTALEKEEAKGIASNRYELIKTSEDQQNDSIDQLIVQSILYKITYFFQNTSLDMYRHVIGQLKNIRAFDETLISNKTINLLEQAEEESFLNEQVKTIYFDSVSGMFNNTGEYSSQKARGRTKPIVVKPLISSEQLSEDKIKNIIGFLDPMISSLLKGNPYQINYEIEEILVTKEIYYKNMYEDAKLC